MYRKIILLFSQHIPYIPYEVFFFFCLLFSSIFYQSTYSIVFLLVFWFCLVFEITIVRGSAKIIKMMMKIVVAKKERRKEMMMKSKVVNVEEPPRLQVHTIIMCHTSKKLNQKK